MVVSALHSSATGLEALSTKLDVIANNLANVNTVGFKRSRANFEDLLYQIRRQPGVENSQGDITPTGIMIGSGVRTSGTELMLDQGGLDNTGRSLDLAIDGQGFFQVRIFPDMGPNGIGYTRAGNFFVNANGELVLSNRNGFRLEPVITLPENFSSVTVTSDGRVLAKVPGSVMAEEVGQIELARFLNPAGLISRGQNVLVESEASGPAIVNSPTEDGMGSIIQSALETSNVEPVRELVEMIQTQRSFELNSQAIQTADEMLRVISNLKR